MGILLFAFAAVLLGVSRLPEGLLWKHITGVSFLAGIGFTMSIFVAILAFSEPSMVSAAKIAIIAASLLAASSGLVLLRIILKKQAPAVHLEVEEAAL